MVVVSVCIVSLGGGACAVGTLGAGDTSDPGSPSVPSAPDANDAVDAAPGLGEGSVTAMPGAENDAGMASGSPDSGFQSVDAASSTTADSSPGTTLPIADSSAAPQDSSTNITVDAALPLTDSGGAGSCAGAVGPTTVAGCHACSPTDVCQPNGCYNLYWCETSSNKCEPRPSGC